MMTLISNEIWDRDQNFQQRDFFLAYFDVDEDETHEGSLESGEINEIVTSGNIEHIRHSKQVITNENVTIRDSGSKRKMEPFLPLFGVEKEQCRRRR